MTMTTPPFSGSRRNTSSGTLRGWSVTALADECEKMTGASVTSSASCMLPGDTCEMSTSMPSQFISRTTSRPNGESPPSSGSAQQESAHGRLALCVSVMYRTPSA